MADAQQAPNSVPRVLVVMGVSGSGKTTIGALLAGRLNWQIADADDFHSAANIEKMHRGEPLNDDDRAPWLRAIAAQIDAWRRANEHAIITCSALRRRYRDVIIGDRTDVRLVYLRGDKALIRHRLVARHGHFMPTSLLDSQFETLEEPAPEEQAVVVPIDQTRNALVEEVIAAVGLDGHNST